MADRLGKFGRAALEDCYFLAYEIHSLNLHWMPTRACDASGGSDESNVGEMLPCRVGACHVRGSETGTRLSDTTGTQARGTNTSDLQAVREQQDFNPRLSTSAGRRDDRGRRIRTDREA